MPSRSYTRVFVSNELLASIERWQNMADDVSKEAGEVQKALVQVRTRHSDLCVEQDKIRYMKLGYIEQLKIAESSLDDLQQSTHLRRFMGQLDRTSQAITEQMAELQGQQRSIAARFRELNDERIKFETLAARAREKIKHTRARKEQKEADMLSAQRYVAKTRRNHGS